MNEITEWLTTTLKSLVGKPEAVEITDSKDEMGVLFTVKLDPLDMGRVIGKGGDTAKAIRTLLRYIGMNRQIRASMKIEEPEGRATPKYADRNY